MRLLDLQEFPVIPLDILHPVDDLAASFLLVSYLGMFKFYFLAPALGDHTRDNLAQCFEVIAPLQVYSKSIVAFLICKGHQAIHDGPSSRALRVPRKRDRFLH